MKVILTSLFQKMVSGKETGRWWSSQNAKFGNYIWPNGNETLPQLGIGTLLKGNTNIKLNFAEKGTTMYLFCYDCFASTSDVLSCFVTGNGRGLDIMLMKKTSLFPLLPFIFWTPDKTSFQCEVMNARWKRAKDPALCYICKSTRGVMDVVWKHCKRGMDGSSTSLAFQTSYFSLRAQ